jgi:RNA recognition motif-containing protein
MSKGFAYVLFETHESAKNALLKMNGKEIDGRQIKVDFDVKQSGKESYKVNLDEEKNRLYNREPIKMEKSKRIKKERETLKLSKIKGFAARK